MKRVEKQNRVELAKDIDCDMSPVRKTDIDCDMSPVIKTGKEKNYETCSETN